VLGFPDVLRNQRSEVLKNFKKLSENGRAVGACPMSQNALSITVTTGAWVEREFSSRAKVTDQDARYDPRFDFSRKSMCQAPGKDATKKQKAVSRVYDAAGNMIETHAHAGESAKRPKHLGFFMLDRSFALGLEIGAWAASGEDSSRLGLCFNEERERINAGARALFLSTATGEREHTEISKSRERAEQKAAMR